MRRTLLKDLSGIRDASRAVGTMPCSEKIRKRQLKENRLTVQEVVFLREFREGRCCEEVEPPVGFRKEKMRKRILGKSALEGSEEATKTCLVGPALGKLWSGCSTQSFDLSSNTPRCNEEQCRSC